MRKNVTGTRNRVLTLGLFLVAVVIILFAAISYNQYALKNTRAVDNQSPLAVSGLSEEDHILWGRTDAKVQVIVYSDLDCPYCKHMYLTTIPKLREKFGDSIVIAYRHLPLQKHPGAYPEAIAAECVYQTAGEIAFRTFITDIYSSHELEGPVPPAELALFAKKVVTDEAAFNTCQKTEATAPRVRRDVVQGAIAGLDVTPSVVLKTKGRSMIIKGDYYSQIATGITFLQQLK